MHEREQSDPAIGAGKPTNKAEAPSVADAAEPVEQRAGAKGNASGQSTLRTQRRERVSQALDRVRKASPSLPKVGAVCLNWVRTDLRGGRRVTCVPTAIRPDEPASMPAFDPGCSLIPGSGSSSLFKFLAGPTVLSAFGHCPPHDGAR